MGESDGFEVELFGKRIQETFPLVVDVFGNEGGSGVEALWLE